MPNRKPTWRDVWTAVVQRQRQLGWTNTELQQRCNISEPTFTSGRIEGRPLRRFDKIAGLEDGMGWARGSVQAILHGGEPTLVETVSSPDAEEMEERLRAEIVAGDALIDARIQALERALNGQLKAMVGQLAALAERLERSRRESEQ